MTKFILIFSASILATISFKSLMADMYDTGLDPFIQKQLDKSRRAQDGNSKWDKRNVEQQRAKEDARRTYEQGQYNREPADQQKQLLEKYFDKKYHGNTKTYNMEKQLGGTDLSGTPERRRPQTNSPQNAPATPYSSYNSNDKRYPCNCVDENGKPYFAMVGHPCNLKETDFWRINDCNANDPSFSFRK